MGLKGELHLHGGSFLFRSLVLDDEQSVVRPLGIGDEYLVTNAFAQEREASALPWVVHPLAVDAPVAFALRFPRMIDAVLDGGPVATHDGAYGDHFIFFKTMP